MTYEQALDAKIDRLEAAVAGQDAIIDKAIAERQIGPGYWQPRHGLMNRLRVARALREALS